MTIVAIKVRELMKLEFYIMRENAVKLLRDGLRGKKVEKDDTNPKPLNTVVDVGAQMIHDWLKFVNCKIWNISISILEIRHSFVNIWTL